LNWNGYITNRGGESKQTHIHRRDAFENRAIFDDGYTITTTRVGESKLPQIIH